VAYRIFEKRLQEKLWDQGPCGCGVDLIVEQQPISKPELFDPKIQIRIFQLFGECSHPVAVFLESTAEKIPKRNHHSPRRGRVFDSQAGNGVERIKKKMRVKLHSKCFQA